MLQKRKLQTTGGTVRPLSAASMKHGSTDTHRIQRRGTANAVDFIAEPAVKKTKTVLSAGKLMTNVFWDSQGIIYIDYLEMGKMVTELYYTVLLPHPPYSPDSAQWDFFLFSYFQKSVAG